MKCNLIPVVEIGYCNQGVPTPALFPPWEHPDEWVPYYAKCYSTAGFPDPFHPVRPGLPLYRLSEITMENLDKLIRDHLEPFFTGEIQREDIVPLFGGYVLIVDDEPLLYPQCCGDLADLGFWRALAAGREDVAWEGHPCPEVTQLPTAVTLNCFDRWEEFCPPVPAPVTVEHACLAAACVGAALEVTGQESRFIALSDALGLDDLPSLLLYGKL